MGVVGKQLGDCGTSGGRHYLIDKLGLWEVLELGTNLSV